MAPQYLPIWGKVRNLNSLAPVKLREKKMKIGPQSVGCELRVLTTTLQVLMCRDLNFDDYLKVSSSKTSRLEAHAGLFRLLMKEL